VQRIDNFCIFEKRFGMSRFIKDLEIKNFKSIRHLKLSCGKINILVGSPNVGKSNILEALSLLGAGYSKPDEHLLSAFIRYENLRNLFYDQSTRNQIEVNAKGVGCGRLRYAEDSQQYELVFGHNESVVQELLASRSRDMALDSANATYADAPGAIVLTALSTGENRTRYQAKGAIVSPVRKYDFRKHEKAAFAGNGYSFLNPPGGENLVEIIQSTPELRKEIGTIFSNYGLELVLDIQNNQLEIQKREDGIVIKTPYALVADTLRRYIYYYAAILSNRKGILLLEEPEAHAFPTYIRALTERIIESSQSNQFFIATHSPYLLNTIIQEVKPEDLRIWATTFENHETVVKQLSNDDIDQLSNYGMDIFFNLNWFVNEGAEDIA